MTGTMKSTDGYEDTVYYDPDSPVEKYGNIVVHHVGEGAGQIASDSRIDNLKLGTSKPVEAKDVAGWEANTASINCKVEHEGDNEYTINYHKKDGEGGKTPTEDPADNGNGDNGGGDNKPNDNDGKPQTNEPDNGGSGGSSDNNAPSSGGNSNPSDADKKKQEEDAADKNGGQTSGGDSPQKPNKDNASEDTTGGGTGTTDNDNGDNEIVDEF